MGSGIGSAVVLNITAEANAGIRSDASYQDTNFGGSNADTITVGDVSYGLQRFNSTGIPSGSIIKSVMLREYHPHQSEGGLPFTIQFRNITSVWVESTVTWNTRPTWSTVNISTVSTGNGGSAYALSPVNITDYAVSEFSNGSKLNILLTSVGAGQYFGISNFRNGILFNGFVTPYISVDYTPPSINITSWGNNATNNQVLNITVLKNQTVRFNVTTNINHANNINTGCGSGIFAGGAITSDKTLYIDCRFNTLGNTSLPIFVSNVSTGTNDTKTWNVNVVGLNITSWGNNVTNNQVLSITVLKNTVVKFNITTNIGIDDFSNSSISCGGYPGSGGFSGGGNTAFIDCIFNAIGTAIVSIKAANITYSTNDTKTWNINVIGINITSWGNNVTNNQSLNINALIGNVVRFNGTTNIDITGTSGSCGTGDYLNSYSVGTIFYDDCRFNVLGLTSFSINLSNSSTGTYDIKTWNVNVYSVPPTALTYNRINHTLTYTETTNPSLNKTLIYIYDSGFNGGLGGWRIVNENFDYTPTNYNIYPEADTWIEDNNPTTNFGTNPRITIASTWWFGYDYWYGLFRFNRSTISAGETVISANLTLTKDDVGGGQFVGYFYNITNRTWTETGVTWNNQPTFAPSFFTEQYLSGTANGTTNTIDIKSYAAGEFSNNRKLDFLIRTFYDVGGRNYASKENGNVTRRPILKIVTTGAVYPPIPGKTYSINLGTYIPSGTDSNRLNFKIESFSSTGALIGSETLNVSISGWLSTPKLYDRYDYNSAGILRLSINKDGISDTDIDRFKRPCQSSTINLRNSITSYLDSNIYTSFVARDEDTGEILYNYTVPLGETLITYQQQIGRPSLSKYGKNKLFIGYGDTNPQYISFGPINKNNEMIRIIDSDSGFLLGNTIYDSVNQTCVDGNQGYGIAYTSGAAFVEDAYTFGQDVNVTWQGDGVYSPVQNISIWGVMKNDTTTTLYLLKNFTMSGSFSGGNFKAFNTEDAQIQTLYNKKLIKDGVWHVATNRLISGEWMSDGISNFNIIFPVAKKTYGTFITLEDFKSGFGLDTIALFLISLIFMFLTIWILGKHFEDSGYDSGHNTTIILFILGVEAFIFMMLGWIPFEVVLVLGILLVLYLVEKIGTKNYDKKQKGGF